MNFLNSQSEDTLSFLANPSEGFSEVIFAESPPEIVYRMSYGTCFYGFKTDLTYYETENPQEAFLDCEIYIDHLRIDGEILINSPTFLTGFDNDLYNLEYKNNGYGLGPSFITDALSNLSFLSNRGIKFYPGYTVGEVRTILEIEKQTRMLLVIRDNWDLGGSITWSILHNYDNLNLTYDIIDDLKNFTEEELFNEVDGSSLIPWSNTIPPTL